MQEQYGFDEQENKTNTSESLQLSVLRFGLPQDGDVGVGVFPEGSQILNGHTAPLEATKSVIIAFFCWYFTSLVSLYS